MDRPEKANAVYELVYSRFQPGSWTCTAGSPRLDVPENENADMTQVVCQEAQSGTGEGAPRLRAPAALPKDAVLIPSTCKVARSSLQLQSRGIRCPFLGTAGTGNTCGSQIHAEPNNSNNNPYT